MQRKPALPSAAVRPAMKQRSQSHIATSVAKEPATSVVKETKPLVSSQSMSAVSSTSSSSLLGNAFATVHSNDNEPSVDVANDEHSVSAFVEAHALDQTVDVVDGDECVKIDDIATTATATHSIVFCIHLSF